MNMITKADIEANKPVIVKWDKPLQSSGVATDGVMNLSPVLKKNQNY